MKLPTPSTDAAAGDRWRAHLRDFHFGRHDSTESDEATLRPAILEADELRPQEATAPPPKTLFSSWAGPVLEDRRRRRAKLLSEVDTLAERLRAMLGLSSAPGGERMRSRLGGIGADFVDPQALATRLAERQDPANLSAERRTRLRAALEALEEILGPGASRPVAYVLASQDHDVPEPPADIDLLRPVDGLRDAIELFDRCVDEALVWVRALRIARLEVGGNYDDAKHGPTLDRLDWRSLTADELLSVPAVVVLETARHLRGPALSRFSELIRHGRPVHVLVREPIADLGYEAPGGYHPGLGYLAVAHREALVVQSSLARPDHLRAGIARAVAALDPVVILAAVPTETLAAPAELQLEAAVQARATPCFVYNPAGGANWADRFALDGNPQPERSWPVYPVTCEDEEGTESSLEQSFTFAHVAALDPGWRGHFRVIDTEAWGEDQIEIAAYLDLTDRERSRCVPYVWIVENDTLVRAVIRWELAFACRDRARAWRILQELAGTDNAYARRAADEARRAAEEEAARKIERLEADFAIALEKARGEGAAAGVDRLVRLLADPRGIDAALASIGLAASRAAPSRPVPAAPQAVLEPAAAPASIPEGPYIDSFLCTTCNDCINVNPRLFRYNANKQAEIGNPAAGTFQQLVKAAEVCPARCIHPGTPRSGDSTATPVLVQRAAKFR